MVAGEKFVNLIDLYINKPKFRLFLNFFLQTPTQLWNCGPGLSIHNTVRGGCNNIKITSKQGARKRCEIYLKSKNIKNSEISSNFFWRICCNDNTWLQAIKINYSVAFYSIFLSFFIPKIFAFNWTSVFVRSLGSISRFGCFVYAWWPVAVGC